MELRELLKKMLTSDPYEMSSIEEVLKILVRIYQKAAHVHLIIL